MRAVDLAEMSTQSPPKFFLKIYSISILCFSPGERCEKNSHFLRNETLKRESEIFSHFAASICATKIFFFFKDFFRDGEDGRIGVFFSERLIRRLDFNCCLALFRIGMANKETNLALSALFSLSWACVRWSWRSGEKKILLEIWCHDESSSLFCATERLFGSSNLRLTGVVASLS